jgi:hypothetical protein
MMTVGTTVMDTDVDGVDRWKTRSLFARADTPIRQTTRARGVRGKVPDHINWETVAKRYRGVDRCEAV